MGAAMSGRQVVACALAAVLAALAAAASGDQSGGTGPGETVADPRAPYVVVLRDGSCLAARSKPTSAFGKFRFVDDTGRTRVMALAAVDVDETTRRNRSVSSEGRGGTLSIGGGVVTATGKATATASAAEAAPTEPSGRKPKTAPSITVYSATWCRYCSELKSFLRGKGLSATIIEVDQLPAAEQASKQAEMKRLTGTVAYPTVVIGGVAKSGFSPAWILAQLDR
jgi:glutaredoxin